MSEFTDPGRKLVDVGGVEVGVFLFKGNFTAFENVCPHLSGPGCQGKMVPFTCEGLNPDGTSRGREFVKDTMTVVCPWHGMEFDITTGKHAVNHRFRLRPVTVWVEGEDVMLSIPDHQLPLAPERYEVDNVRHNEIVD
ncbi:MAG: Rieske 2Fe-2S domain-containing protein [Microbacterium sp.]